jgi:hypothetical protein
MDRRGFGVIGAIASMVIAGLIVYALITYGPSIVDRLRSSGGASIADIVNNSSKYEGKDVEVVGDFGYAPGSIFEGVHEVENYYLSGYTVTDGNYSLKLAMNLYTEYVAGGELTGSTVKVRVQGRFKSPDIILAKRIARA